MASIDPAYFPRGTFSADSPQMDVFIRQWYSKHLRSKQEPVIHTSTSAEAVTYRFLCLPTFDAPFVIRVQLASGDATLNAKSTSGQGGYDTGELEVDEQITLTPKQATAIEQAILQAHFWSLDSTEDHHGLDGTHFVAKASATIGIMS